MSEAFGFRLVASPDTPGFMARIRRTIEGHGFSVAEQESPRLKTPGLLFSADGKNSMSMAFTIESGWPALTMYPVERAVFQEYGGEKIGALLEAIGGATPVHIARTFDEGLHATITTQTLGREPIYIDWVQIFGPELVKRWGADVLKKGPFFRTSELPNGSWALWTRPDPYAEGKARTIREAADYLGIDLEPHYVKIGKDEKIKVDWP
jgi:hypothetical protein